MTVDQFEAFVQQQQPASVPWTPVTDYSFEARKQIEGPHPQLIKDVFQPTVARDIGCGAGTLVALLRAIGVKAFGADRQFHHPRWSDITREYGRRRGKSFEHLFDFVDVTSPSEYFPPVDLVICREVLEHLTIKQIRVAVTNLCLFSSRFVYVTTRFHPNPHSLLDVMDHDDLDPTHITLLNQDFLRTLFVLEGFKRRADLEQQMDWQGKKRVLVYER